MRNPAAWTMMYHGWFDADISDQAKLTIWAIYSFFNQQTREWIEIPTVERVAKLRKITPRNIREHYKELESAGLIRRQRTPLMGGGSVLKIELIEPSRDNPSYLEPCSEEDASIPLRRGCQYPPPKRMPASPSINTKTLNPKTSTNTTTTTKLSLSTRGENLPSSLPISHTSPQKPEPEPFEIGPQDRALPNPAAHRVDRTPLPDPVQMPVEMVSRIQGILGTDTVARHIKQEHVDSGFVNYALEACSRRKVKNPAGLFMSLLQSDYRPGWASPQEVLRQKREERLSKIDF